MNDLLADYHREEGKQRFGSSDDIDASRNSLVVPARARTLPIEDIAVVGIVVLLWFGMVLWRQHLLPLQSWDESRNAVNALEMARSGNWLVPQYNGLADHWNTKPPLLIWGAAALMRLGLSPILAVRLLPMLAALGTALLVWSFCRLVLRDRVAAAIGPVLLLSTSLFSGIHVGKTGDYDALLIFVVTASCLSFWIAVENRSAIRFGWLVAAFAAMFLAVMTKGVAGTFAAAGLVVYAVVTGRLWTLLRDVRVWLLVAVLVAMVAGYYGSRELYDPGYLKAVWANELGGRFVATSEGHDESLLFYPRLLKRNFLAGMLMASAILYTLGSADSRRRNLAILLLCCAGAVFAVISASATKLNWYVAQTVPFVSLMAAVGLSDLGRRFAARWPRLRPGAGIALVVVLGIVAAGGLYHSQVVLVGEQRNPGDSQKWYGLLLDDAAAGRLAGGRAPVLQLVDNGITETTPDDVVGAHYNPLIDFHGKLAREQGLEVLRLAADEVPRTDAPVATCDPNIRRTLEDRLGLKPVNQWCSYRAARALQPLPTE